MPSDITNAFPSLRDFQVTSPPDSRYNCVAWAAGMDDEWWWPNGIDYWPPEAPLDITVSAFIVAFAPLGFETCDSGALEEGVEKVAIYALPDGRTTHTARQLSTGRWTSKLGSEEDIEHASPAELEGAVYGAVVGYMRRVIDEAT